MPQFKLPDTTQLTKKEKATNYGNLLDQICDAAVTNSADDFLNMFEDGQDMVNLTNFLINSMKEVHYAPLLRETKDVIEHYIPKYQELRRRGNVTTIELIRTFKSCAMAADARENFKLDMEPNAFYPSAFQNKGNMVNKCDELLRNLDNGYSFFRGSSRAFKNIQNGILKLKQIENSPVFKRMDEAYRNKFERVCISALRNKANEYIAARSRTEGEYARDSYKGSRIYAMRLVANKLDHELSERQHGIELYEEAGVFPEGYRQMITEMKNAMGGGPALEAAFNDNAELRDEVELREENDALAI